MSAYESPLDDDTLADVADLRARGKGWDAVAAELDWNVRDLRRAVRHAPDFDRAYERAAREVRDEAAAEALATFRTRMRDKDPDRSQRGAEAVDRHTAAVRRDEVRLEVERLRAGVAQAKAGAKRARDEDDDGVGCETVTAEQAARERALEDRWAAEAHAGRATVWLWGGRHPIPDAMPGDGDVPLVLMRDQHQQVCGRVVYWAFKPPLPGHIVAGPFPPRRPVNLPEPLPCPPEMAGAPPVDDTPAA